MQVLAVIFDLDGVLIDSEPLWEEVRRGVVTEHGGHWPPGTQERLMGMNTVEWAAYLADELLDGTMASDEVAYEVIDRMHRRYAEGVPLLPGAVAAVRRLAESFPLGLNSSSPRILMELVLGSLGLDSLFRATVSTEEVDLGKPAPDGYLTAAARLDTPPGRCAAIEDSAEGFRSAHAAGMRVIAVPRPGHPPPPDALALVSHTAAGLDAVTADTIREAGAAPRPGLGPAPG
ncbi:HAD family phosphatase [Actinomadura viridis]|uniref:HAD superfamily hydrolase (TIGR01509 family) n=1 Tax=Actinomadura viridis TaxID=58110 RepID=A0A931GLF9_9ACTN|nr:HAD family phosphatase [Actinomadura viridis]MBG6092013.1 HAD superfamily hydrolase (TIGR01509 family) [Actinomadura viridis]